MRVAVTGTTGFLGRTIVPTLRSHGHEVIALDRAVTGDITKVDDWTVPLANADAVVHLAALAHARGIDEALLRAVNVEASIAIGKAAAAGGVRMVFMSSAKVFGEETSGPAFDERSPLAPQDAYGRAKLEAEESLRAIAGLKLTVLRPPLVYGPGVGANFLALMRAVARGWPLPLASIGNRRSLVGAGNLADVVSRCLAVPRSVGRTFCVTDGVPLSTPALCRVIGAALQREARLLAFPPALLEFARPARKLTRSLVLDDQEVRRNLGWTPPYSVDEGMRRTAEWFLAQGG